MKGMRLFPLRLFETPDYVITCLISPGYYINPPTLITKINRRTERVVGPGRVKFEYDSLINRVRVTTQDCGLTVSETLRRIMGFSQKLINNMSVNETSWSRNDFNLNSSLAPISMDMNHGIYSMYVYCDIVERRMVGDALVPLLRVVPTHAQHGDIVHIAFSNHHYIPVHSKNFETIRIWKINCI